ncbi:reverse transcriptase domain-containing protein [Tanacetum coccineum]|uniref:Reverse transcriptase domain-containing protein n=1 Tax=Tanacetum coccineum TaxID=301880 RepID=A0ABQ5F8L3_9ASTR
MSSASSNQSRRRVSPPTICECEEPIILQTAKTIHHPMRHFLGCINYYRVDSISERNNRRRLIKVDKFILPIDFVILDMPEDSRVPIILGRPFLATARAMIDVFNKKITLRVGDEEVVFDVDQSSKRPTTEDDECYGIDDLDKMINDECRM